MFTSTQHPDETGGPRVLVAYASRHGSTAEIAEAITFELRRSGFAVDCLGVDAVHDASGYAAIVLGSAVYIGRWRREARHFLHDQESVLARVPFWIFSTGPIGEPHGSADPWDEPRRVLAQAQKLGVRGHFAFGGRVPQHPDTWVERAMLRNTPAQFADRRDWDETRARAREIAEALEALEARVATR
jgi:menaquinone-dependent protoporphyrinogen oxidase